MKFSFKIWLARPAVALKFNLDFIYLINFVNSIQYNNLEVFHFLFSEIFLAMNEVESISSIKKPPSVLRCIYKSKFSFKSSKIHISFP